MPWRFSVESARQAAIGQRPGFGQDRIAGKGIGRQARRFGCRQHLFGDKAGHQRRPQGEESQRRQDRPQRRIPAMIAGQRMRALARHLHSASLGLGGCGQLDRARAATGPGDQPEQQHHQHYAGSTHLSCDPSSGVALRATAVISASSSAWSEIIPRRSSGPLGRAANMITSINSRKPGMTSTWRRLT